MDTPHEFVFVDDVGPVLADLLARDNGNCFRPAELLQQGIAGVLLRESRDEIGTLFG